MLKIISVSFAILFGILSSQLHAGITVDSREDKVQIQQQVDASADEVWALLAKLDGIEQFVPQMFKSSTVAGKGKGAERICTHHNGDKLIEEILAFDSNSRTYTYSVKSGVMPVADMINRVQVLSLSNNRSLIVWSSKFDLPPSMSDASPIQNMIATGLSAVAKGVKLVAEEA